MNALISLSLAFQLQIPQPVGFVNDFAGVIDPTAERQMLAVIEQVRGAARGEIAVVTLRDLGGRAPIEVAVQIGREWGVGAEAGAGDPAKNAGVVLLLVPGERPGDGRAQLAIATGRGVEGFLTDARSGRIRDAIGRASVETGSYAQGLVAGVWLLAEAYAEEFGFALTGSAPVRTPPPRSAPPPPGVMIFAALLTAFVVLSLFAGMARAGTRYRYRYGRRVHGPSGLEWLLFGMLLGGGHRRGGWRGGGGWGGGGGGWGGGGFGGGGFGGFGGGGGFSGGGASGSF